MNVDCVPGFAALAGETTGVKGAFAPSCLAAGPRAPFRARCRSEWLGMPAIAAEGVEAGRLPFAHPSGIICHNL